MLQPASRESPVLYPLQLQSCSHLSLTTFHAILPFMMLTLTRWPSYTNLTGIPSSCTRRPNINFIPQAFQSYLMALSFTEPELCAIKVYIAGIGRFWFLWPSPWISDLHIRTWPVLPWVTALPDYLYETNSDNIWKRLCSLRTSMYSTLEVSRYDDTDIDILYYRHTDTCMHQKHYHAAFVASPGFLARRGKNGNCLLYTSPSPRD